MLEREVENLLEQQLRKLNWKLEVGQKDRQVYRQQPRSRDEINNLKTSGSVKFPDFILYESDKVAEPIAIIETKRPEYKDLEQAKKQGMLYATALKAKFLFLYNANRFITYYVPSGENLFVDGIELTELVSLEDLIKFKGNKLTLNETAEIKSKSDLINVFKVANDKLREAGVNAGIARFAEFSNLLFLKLVSELNNERHYNISKPYLWETYRGMDSDVMLQYINATVIPGLNVLFDSSEAQPLFTPLRIKNPIKLKEIVNKLDTLDLKKIDTDIKGDAFEYFIQKYEISHKKNSDFFSFGMGDRKKLIYKKGKLIDLQTKQTVRSFDFTHEMIIPNMYTVLLLDQAGKITRIYEDETGVHIEKGRMARIWEDWNNYNQWEDDRLNNRETKLVENITTETISTSKNKINLPNFEESKVGRILKVLHQEILVNINQGKPRTTLMAKTNESGLYREGMMAAMVLEETKNTWLFENWMKQIGSIYDCRNKLEKNEPKCVESADNPGQLLYLLGAITNNRQDLINKIRTEVKQKAIDGEFTGKVDEEEMGYYPTALLINGGRKNRIELGYDFNLGKPDKYLGLTWWLNDYKEAKHGNIVDPMHPAKEWASVHQEPGHYGLTTILDEAYPLTFDGELTEAEAEEQKLINEHYSHEKGPRLSSIWHASEMFLMLNNRE